MGAAAALPYIIAAIGAGASYVNTENTAHRQDEALSQSIRDQAGFQKKADAKVDNEVQDLSKSTADASRQKALDGYVATLIQNKKKTEAGLTPNVGGDAFKADSATAAQGVDQYGNALADTMSRIDAPTMQRQQEAFGYGNLATDLGLVDRQASGQDFIDQLRLRQIRRNPALDFGASLAQGAGSAMANDPKWANLSTAQWG